MEITDTDVNLYRQFANEEIDMPQLIYTIKNEIGKKWSDKLAEEFITIIKNEEN